MDSAKSSRLEHCSTLQHMNNDIFLLVFSFFMPDKLTVIVKSPLKELLNTAATCKGFVGSIENVIDKYMLTPAPFTRFITDKMYMEVMAKRPKLCLLKLPEQRSRNWTAFDRAGLKFLRNTGDCMVLIGLMGIKQGQTVHKVNDAMLQMLSFQQFIPIRVTMYQNFWYVFNEYAKEIGLHQNFWYVKNEYKSIFTFGISERLYENGTPRLPKGENINPGQSFWTLGMENAVIRNPKQRPHDWETSPHMESYLTCDAEEVFVIINYIISHNDGFTKNDALFVKMKVGSSLGPLLNRFLTFNEIEGDGLHFVSCYPVGGVFRYHVVDPEDTANQATGRIVGDHSFTAPLHLIYLCATALLA